ncbi:MAG: hypothetical protein K2O54_04375, partial [Prevotella sp.]|nr:hypothetical protein [Prevotella sp.]
DDPIVDIINTSEDIAENSVVTSADEEVSDEELLAQLLEDKGGEDECLISEELDTADDSDDDYEIDQDDIIDA